MSHIEEATVKVWCIAMMSVLVWSGSSSADEFIKIMKVKGQKAIVKLPSANFQKGDEVKIQSGLFSAGMTNNGRRKYRVDFDAVLGQTSEEVAPESGDSTTSSGLGLDTDITFGFNQGQFEYGPILGLGYSNGERDTGTVTKVTTTSFDLGGFFEYNFKENKRGVELVPYVGVQLAYNSTSTTSEPEEGDATETTSSGLAIGLEGGVKYFMFNDHFAINAGARFTNTSLTDQDSKKTTTTEIGLFSGVGVYF
jgi:hypothetical protein